MNRFINIFLFILMLGIAIYFAIFGNISWDEGWNFCVAQNLAEHQHFGCSILGQFTNARLANGWFPIVTAAMGFKLFGSSIVAARVFISLLTVLGIYALCSLSKLLVGSKALIPSLVILLLLSSDERIHPLIVGGQVWGEMPMILMVTIGLGLLATGLKGSSWIQVITVIAASVCFGIALQTKVQLQPFLFIALALTSLKLLMEKKWGSAVVMLATVIGAWMVSKYVYPPFPSKAITPDNEAGTLDAAKAVGFVANWEIRKLNFGFALKHGWYLFVSLIYLGFRYFNDGFKCRALNDARFDPIFSTLYLIVAGWLAWFVLLAVDFPRYLAPPLILGAPLVAIAALDVTKGDLLERLRRWGREIFGPPAPLKKLLIVGLVGLSFSHLAVTAFNLGKVLVYRYQHQANPDMIAMANYINTKTAPNSIIETYESMFFFMLDRPFHYPPDQINIDKIKESYSGVAAVKYDPLSANPDYILVGPWDDSVFKLYQDLIKTDQVVKQIQIGGFRLYRVIK